MSTAISPSGTDEAQVDDRAGVAWPGKILATCSKLDQLRAGGRSAPDQGAEHAQTRHQLDGDGAGGRQNTAMNVAAAPAEADRRRAATKPPPTRCRWKLGSRLSERPTPGTETQPMARHAATRFIRYSQPSVGRRNTKNPALRWLVTNATVSVPMMDRPGRCSGVSRPTIEPDARPRELGETREPGVQDARLHAEALEPAGGALDLAAPVDVVVAVGDHRHAHRDAQHEQPASHT